MRMEEEGATAQLVAQLSDRYPLVAYSALRALEARDSEQVVRCVQWLVWRHELIHQSPPTDSFACRLLLTPESLQAKSAFCFQLLRRLLARESSTVRDSDSSSDSDTENEDESRNAVVVRVALTCADVLSKTAIALMRPPIAPTALESDSSAAFELLSFVSEAAEQLATAETTTQDRALGLAATLMDAFAADDGGFGAHPTYVSSAAVACLHSLLRLVRSMDSEVVLSTRVWRQRLLRLVIGERASLTRLALALLQRPRAACDDDAFVSTTSRFPFLQRWLTFAASVALALVTTRTALDDDDDGVGLWTLLGMSSGARKRPAGLVSDSLAGAHTLLPDRPTLLAVLSEQDDVMVDVLNTLLQLTVALEASDTSNRRSTDTSYDNSTVADVLRRYVDEQLDPDLLFVDVLETFGFDHLVLLDLLISSGRFCSLC